MSYNIKIGEPYVSIDKDDNIVTIEVEEVKLECAPAIGESTDYINQQRSGYSAWSETTRFIGLYDLFFDENSGLMKDHPGIMPLNVNHKKKIDFAYEKFYEKYPNAKPGFSPKIHCSKNIFEDADWPDENVYAVWLEWLKFWINWALTNCENPVFKNG